MKDDLERLLSEVEAMQFLRATTEHKIKRLVAIVRRQRQYIADQMEGGGIAWVRVVEDCQKLARGEK